MCLVHDDVLAILILLRVHVGISSLGEEQMEVQMQLNDLFHPVESLGTRSKWRTI